MQLILSCSKTECRIKREKNPEWSYWNFVYQFWSSLVKWNEMDIPFCTFTAVSNMGLKMKEIVRILFVCSLSKHTFIGGKVHNITRPWRATLWFIHWGNALLWKTPKRRWIAQSCRKIYGAPFNTSWLQWPPDRKYFAKMTAWGCLVSQWPWRRNKSTKMTKTICDVGSAFHGKVTWRALRKKKKKKKPRNNKGDQRGRSSRRPRQWRQLWDFCGWLRLQKTDWFPLRALRPPSQQTGQRGPAHWREFPPWWPVPAHTQQHTDSR